jgi:hypothetical protein
MLLEEEDVVEAFKKARPEIRESRKKSWELPTM